MENVINTIAELLSANHKLLLHLLACILMAGLGASLIMWVGPDVIDGHGRYDE